MSTQRDVAAAIRGAIKRIETAGWTQKYLGDDDRGYCMVGAITAGWSNSVACNVTTAELGRWLEPFVEESVGVSPIRIITMFNDAPGRTKEEVLFHMNKLADELDPRNHDE